MMEHQQKKNWKSEPGGNGDAQKLPQEWQEERFRRVDGMSINVRSATEVLSNMKLE